MGYSEWINISEPSNCNEPAVYKIRLTNNEGSSGDTILNSPCPLSLGRVFDAVTICPRHSPISPQN